MEAGGKLRIAMTGNGATVHALVRGAAIAALGHEVRLFTLGPVLPHPGIDVRTRPLPSSPVAGLRAFLSFQKDLRDFQPDLLHVHFAGGRLGSLALASGIKPLVVTVMGGDVQPEQLLGRARAADHRTTERLLREASVILAKSDALRAEIARYGNYESKVETVRWGIETARFTRDSKRGEAMRQRLGLLGGPVLLSSRILRPLYNIHLIVEAMPAILARVPEATLLVSRHREDAQYAAKIRARVRELGIDARVRFIDPVPYDEMPDLLSTTSVVISVPFSDGLPQTLFEGLASQTPLVMGRLAAYDEIVAHEREVLMADLDAPSIAAAVTKILTDADLATRLAKAGLERILSVASLPDEARRVEALYRRALAEPKLPSPIAPRILDAMSLAWGRG
jgi:glycosyltransferase involved in cell wall biosynthesis